MPLLEKGLTFEVQSKWKPGVIMFDVSRDMTEEHIKETIMRNNSGITEKLSKEILDSEMNFRFKLGPRDKDTQNDVIHVTHPVRKLLIGAGRILLGWKSCRIMDYLVQPRCYKGLGHISKH